MPPEFGGSVTVRCFGRYWVLRDVPASAWIGAVLTEDMAGIFPGLVDDDDAEAMLGLWLSESDMRQRCINVSRRALERAAGREWHWARNLVEEIQGSWTFLNGRLVREGVRADRAGLADYLDAAYTLFLELLPDKERKAFDMRLRRLPVRSGVSKPAMSSRADLAAFAAD